jgi:hypothetical protein
VCQSSIDHGSCHQRRRCVSASSQMPRSRVIPASKRGSVCTHVCVPTCLHFVTGRASSPRRSKARISVHAVNACGLRSVVSVSAFSGRGRYFVCSSCICVGIQDACHHRQTLFVPENSIFFGVSCYEKKTCTKLHRLAHPTTHVTQRSSWHRFDRCLTILVMLQVFHISAGPYMGCTRGCVPMHPSPA